MAALDFICSYPQLVGIPLILVYGLWRYSSTKGADNRTDWLLAAAAIAVPAELAAQAVTVWLSHLRPLKCDLFIYWLDGRLGFQPSFAIGQLAAHNLWLRQLLSFTYGNLRAAKRNSIGALLHGTAGCVVCAALANRTRCRRHLRRAHRGGDDGIGAALSVRPARCSPIRDVHVPAGIEAEAGCAR